MLELQNIKKYYRTGDLVTKALDGVFTSFRENEFVAILGESGSGKTTLLNIIGGLDNYDEGDLIINGQSTRKFSESDWDAYRNNSIGFVFQSYNLIHHLSVLDNVELGMTLSNVSTKKRRELSENALAEVGLYEHRHKRPSQLSGGQMQRVAIARALANNPDILLCDEPTGALDSETGLQIMELIKKVAQDRLVIMVTHNAQLARQYASRIIRFHDGKILTDSHHYDNSDDNNRFRLVKTRMSFLTAISLSLKNLRTKLGATTLTSFASSIGIISIGIVLALSNGFQKEIDRTQEEALAQFPITISSQLADTRSIESSEPLPEFPAGKEIIVQESEFASAMHTNNLSDDYLDYLQAINPNIVNNIAFNRPVQLNLLRIVDEDIKKVSLSSMNLDNESQMMGRNLVAQATGVGISTFPHAISGESNFLEANYDLLAGQWPKDYSDLVFVTETDNSVNINSLRNLGFNVEDEERINFKQIVGTVIYLIHNDQYYEPLANDNFIPSEDYQAMVSHPQSEELFISAVLRPKKDVGTAILANGIAYSDLLNEHFIRANQTSEIVLAQERLQRNVFTNETLDEAMKEAILAQLGASSQASNIYLYPNDFNSKEELIDYLNAYNEDKNREDQVLFTDLASAITEMTGSLLNGITLALIAFAAISLVSSTIMIGIITYNSVLQRTKEIGLLKALGARKKDITRVFDAENFILGLFSGIIGIASAYLITIPINLLIEQITEIPKVTKLDPLHALSLIIVAIVIHLFGGHIPARMAAQQNASDALRAE